jgi:hypothetical protein
MFDSLPNQMQGFAHGPGEAVHPHLWAGYLGGMTPCLGLAGRNAPDVSPYRYDGVAQANPVLMTITGSPIGPAIRFTGGAAIQWNGDSSLGNKFKVANGERPITIHAYFRYVHKTSANKMTLFRSDDATVGSLEYGYHLYVEANADSLKFETHRGETGLEVPPIVMPVYTAAGALTGGKWHNVVVTWWPKDVEDPYQGQYVMMNIDGKWIYPTFINTERDIIHLNSQHSRCGASFGNTAPDLEVALVEVWNRRLPWRAIDLLMADPSAVFRRRGGGLSKGSRLVSIGGTALRRASVTVAG